MSRVLLRPHIKLGSVWFHYDLHVDLSQLSEKERDSLINNDEQSYLPNIKSLKSSLLILLNNSFGIFSSSATVIIKETSKLKPAELSVRTKLKNEENP